jgi:alpha/beta superfamily hydrolase
MNAHTQKQSIAGPSGAIECAIDGPASPSGAPRGVAVLCHPHPQHGGTMHNKVVQTLARAFTQLGYTAVRFNFRGVGASAGAWSEGIGEIDDALAVVASFHQPSQALVLGGFSFGGYVAGSAAARLAAAGASEPPAVQRLVLVAPAVSRFDLGAVAPDTLVIHGEVDDVVPLAAVLDWARPTSLPITVIPGAGHFFHGQLALLKSLVVGAWHD